MKVPFGMALSQTSGFVERPLQLINLDWAAPNFSSLSRQKTLKINIPHRRSADPLQFRGQFPGKFVRQLLAA